MKDKKKAAADDIKGTCNIPQHQQRKTRPLKQSAGVTESWLESFLFQMSVQLLVPNGSIFILWDKQLLPLLEMVYSLSYPQLCAAFLPLCLRLGGPDCPRAGDWGGTRAINMPESGTRLPEATFKNPKLYTTAQSNVYSDSRVQNFRPRDGKARQ